MTSNLKTYDLTVNFLGYWFIGTGSEVGAYSDQLTQRDEKGFPYVPGKSLKGVFREAFRTAANSGWFDKFNRNGLESAEFANQLIQTIFGHDGTKDGFSDDELHAEGLIHFSSAVLPQSLKDRIDKEQQEFLFTTVQSTKINSDRGVAEEKSLRTVEVAVPMHLHAEVTLDPPYEKTGDTGLDLSAEELKEIAGIFAAVSSLVTEIGGKRRRGFGRCLWEMKEV
ncbi:MAG: hypothetical protein IJ523_11225 [Succinivibrionaceae bacterium]|nr:hypothetical protein [Succinivibrionaceae bacterium]